MPENKLTTTIYLSILIISITSCKSNYNIGENGKIKSGKVYLNCTKPSKRYTKSVELAVKGSLKGLDTVKNNSLSASLRTKVVLLTDYSQRGLDLDLILFRVCEMANNRSLNSNQTDSLIAQAVKAWNNQMSINEQKNVLSQLKTELSSNLKTANELKLNVETILSSLNLISGDQILRNPKIKILAVFFPKSNLNNPSAETETELVNQSIATYLQLKLDTNRLEKQKFTAAGKVIALTIEETYPTLISLSDKDGTRYPVYNTIWNANAQNLSKIDIFETTLFQQSYSDLNSLKTNYSIVINRSLDYLSALNKFFQPQNNIITKESIVKILTSERLCFELIETYSKSLLQNIEALSQLEISVQKTLN